MRRGTKIRHPYADLVAQDLPKFQIGLQPKIRLRSKDLKIILKRPSDSRSAGPPRPLCPRNLEPSMEPTKQVFFPTLLKWVYISRSFIIWINASLVLFSLFWKTKNQLFLIIGLVEWIGCTARPPRLWGAQCPSLPPQEGTIGIKKIDPTIADDYIGQSAQGWEKRVDILKNSAIKTKKRTKQNPPPSLYLITGGRAASRPRWWESISPSPVSLERIRCLAQCCCFPLFLVVHTSKIFFFITKQEKKIYSCIDKK